MILKAPKREKSNGTVIQFKNYPYKKGDKTTSIIITEDISIVYNRIKTLYEQLSENQEVTIKHIK